ncbi:hypothetical protein [Geopsychrobacter electrodiphilus]|uniref:hypothetical protein n=1 Tax=Geopsychrobacter electrodiphilus TaxID=225196 RepID=UPI000367F519|nr:hypothetical protein [Geopsychrobacter electrodiphilus]
MNLLVCIDDTDNLESRGTGELASMLALQLEEQGWGSSSYVTRHQLLVHPDIPYTSHNSAMCFAASLNENCPVEQFIDYAGRFLLQESAPESDPGLCVMIPADLGDESALLAFGRAAKKQVLTKNEAYTLARQTDIHLSEHGGTGQGVIGALAGVGLRLGGNDGRLKGQLRFGMPAERIKISALRAHPLVDCVRTLDGLTPSDGEEVVLGEKIKTVLLEGQSVLLLEAVREQGGMVWRTCSRQQLKNY